MAKLKIFTFPDVVLTQKAKPVERVGKSYHKVTEDMLETMYDAPGIGLAANQVGILERFLVLDTEYDLEELESGETLVTRRKPIIIFNPRIVLKEGDILFKEGCLSVPEYTADVKRSEKIKLEYQDIDGLTRTLSADGLQAVAIQHEMDHLDGFLFIDRLSPMKKEMARKRLRKERLEREAELEAKLRRGHAGFPDPAHKKGKGF